MKSKRTQIQDKKVNVSACGNFVGQSKPRKDIEMGQDLAVYERFAKWGVHITRHGMTFDHPLDDEQYRKIGRTLLDEKQRIDMFFAFVIGDWVNAIPWGNQKDEILKEFGDGFMYRARKFASLARHFSIEWRERYPDIKSISVWQEIQPAASDTAVRLLQQAQAQHGAISRQHIRDTIAAEKFPLAPASPDKVNAMLSKGSGGVGAAQPQSGTLEWENKDDEDQHEMAGPQAVPPVEYADGQAIATAPTDTQEPTDFEQVCIPNQTMAQLREIARHWTRKHHKPYRPEDVIVNLAATVYEQMQERG